ncbi:hypothetical protein, partial [Candidatus Pelagibacter communis]|uniref:hypothetical protein n=1 Tax=Pelagibacter ubique TaxID=198252 RepID=UPI0015CF248D
QISQKSSEKKYKAYIREVSKAVDPTSKSIITEGKKTIKISKRERNKSTNNNNNIISLPL